MSVVLATLKKVLFWSYDRGSWQYDVMCVLILAFIFFGPNSVFHAHRELSTAPMYISSQEIGQVEQGRIEQEIGFHLSQKYGHAIKVARIEPDVDSSGNLKGYFAWER